MSQDDRHVSLEEEEEVRVWAEKMGPDKSAQILEFLAARELDLLRDPRIGSDPAMRSITLQNVAALVTAVRILSPESVVRGEQPELDGVDSIPG